MKKKQSNHKRLYIILFLIILILSIILLLTSLVSKFLETSRSALSLPVTTLTLEPSHVIEDLADQISERTQVPMPEIEKPILNPNRITYQLDFYHEPLSSAIKERITGVSFRENDVTTYDDLRYISVLYVDFNGDTQIGELISSKTIADDLVEIFYELYQANYQIDKIKLIDDYNADDDLSCMDNNSSAFNYRTIGGTDRLSNHGLGLAIDINPVYNPYVTYPNGVERISPAGSEMYGDRSQDFPHKIDENDLCYQLFIEHGFTWGGNWNSIKDYQHFEKKIY